MRNPLLDEAASAFDRDEIRLAEELYLKCLAQDPQDAEALRELALIVYGFKRDSLRAKELVENSLNIENSPKAHFILGMILNNLRIYPQADEELEYAIKATRGLAVFHSMYGDILVARQQFEEAKVHFMAALSDEPDYEPAQKSYARLLELIREEKGDKATGTHQPSIHLGCCNPKGNFSRQR